MHVYKVTIEWKQDMGWNRDNHTVVARTAQEVIDAAMRESKRTEPRDAATVHYRLGQCVEGEGVDLVARGVRTT